MTSTHHVPKSTIYFIFLLISIGLNYSRKHQAKFRVGGNGDWTSDQNIFDKHGWPEKPLRLIHGILDQLNHRANKNDPVTSLTKPSTNSLFDKVWVEFTPGDLENTIYFVMYTSKVVLLRNIWILRHRGRPPWPSNPCMHVLTSRQPDA